jgi:hypothetical protein
MARCFDRNGEPMTTEQWMLAFADTPSRIIGRTKLSDDVEVSTVWMGLDHNFMEDGPPLIFESMVFGGPMDDETRRYSTEEEARAGHDELVSAALDSVEA